MLKATLEEIDDLKETLNFTDGFGIVAPQAGINKMIVIIQVDKEKCTYKDCEEVPTTVMINQTWKKYQEIQKLNLEVV